jgi:predicted membrane-bound spermidine synthase
MTGMAAGASMARKLAAKRRALAWACAAGALMSAFLTGALAVASRWPQVSTSLMLLGVVVAGASTGAIYPLTVAVAARRHAAARMYAWDLAGAAGAALLVSLLAVPLLGLYSVTALAGCLYAVAALANLGRADAA